MTTKFGDRPLRIAIGFLVVILGATASTSAAMAADAYSVPNASVRADADGLIDPATFEGPLVVATDTGDITVELTPGQASAFANRTDARIESLSSEAQGIIEHQRVPDACGVWINAVAGPNVWWDSVDGCAVVGYPGYVRPYEWANATSITACVRARGWNPGEVWISIGCGGGGSASIPWGNSLAYTKVSGMSLSGVTGAAYRWKS